MHVEAKAYHIYAARIFIPLIDCTSGWFITLAHAIAFTMRSITYPKTICLHMFRLPNKKNTELNQKTTKRKHWYTWLHSCDTLKYLYVANISLYHVINHILFQFFALDTFQVHWSHKFYSISFKDNFTMHNALFGGMYCIVDFIINNFMSKMCILFQKVSFTPKRACFVK